MIAVKLKNKAMQTLLVTIVGFESSFDLQVPAEVPVGKLIPMILKICAFPQMHSAQPGRTKWTLSIADSNTTLPAMASLLDAGVADGTILLLEDASSPRRSQQIPEPQQVFRPTNIEPGEYTGDIGVKWNIR